VLEFLARAIRQERKLKQYKQERQKSKLSLLVDDTILYLKDPKDCTKKPLDLINTFSKIAGHNINVQKSATFHVPIMNRLRKKSGKQPHQKQYHEKS
jgi:hypothetical protein